MIHIQKATYKDCLLIAKLGETTFLETYLINTTKTAVEIFINKAFHIDTLAEELCNPNIHYYIIYDDDTIAGYSKIAKYMTKIN